MTSPPRVLMTTPSFDTMGGIQVFAETLSRVLPDVVDPLFVGARNGESGATVILRRIIRDTSQFVLHALRNPRCLVHINTSLDRKSLVRDGVLLILACLLRRRTLVYIHGWSPQVEEGLRRSSAPVFRRVFGRATMIAVLAHRFAVSLKQLGVHTPVVREMTFVDDALLEHLRGLPPRTAAGRRLLYLSRAIRPKGIFTAIEVLERVQVRYPGATLCIAGDGADRPEAERMVRERGLEGVHFAGHITGGFKYRLLAESDVFLFPSTYGEGVPISLLEAMAAGLPAVTTRAGGIPDFFKDGEMGESLPEADPARMADAVDRLFASPRTMSAMSAFNAAFVRDHCTAAGAAARFMGHYNALQVHR